MTLPDRLRLPLTFDPGLLAQDLEGLSGDAWTAHFVTQNYDGDWSVLALRGPASARHPIQAIYSDPSTTDFADTALMARCPNIATALTTFRCELQSIRLMRLTAGSTIKEHSDHDLDAEGGMARLHVAITTNPGVVFEVNRKPVVLAPGNVWYLRLSDPHRVANHGTTDRVHLVIDAVVNDWLRETLQGSLAGA